MSWSFGVFSIPLFIVGVIVAVLAVIFVVVPLFQGVGWMIGNVFKAIGWLIAHIFEFIFGVIGDAIRFVGAIPVGVIFGLLSMLNVVIGRWSAANHFADATWREFNIGWLCLYRIAIRRPLKLVYLHGLVEGVEERVPAAFIESPGRDKPSRRTGKFDGYTIVGSLRGGGSGGKLYIAEPSPEKKAAIPTIPDRVVIKSFALSDGSSLPQIVRESRALECAKQLGHVIEHGMDTSRFFYVMPYIPGDHLGITTRDLHAKGSGNGLNKKQLHEVMDYTSDLLATLSAYHRGGFWHKDVKPDNVIVNDGRAHLVDLGLVTALRSAMTLTTHGTEYFRDPEMVRQALRGVKVHQVDGTKFDIFAAGAVLYFMLENTFPAHGGLSKFHKKSPDALHWIVRRAMAEYQQRYNSAEMMLADLHFVNTHSDPFAVKAAELPSMKGATISEIPIEAPDPVKVVHAGTPQPPRDDDQTHEPALKGFGVVAGLGAGGAHAQAGRFAVDSQGRPVSKGSPGKRPRLRVTNWWTGEYVVEDAGSAQTDTRSQYRATDARAAASEAWRAAKVQAKASGRTAKEQLHSARKRASDLRQRARSSRHKPLRAPAEKPGLAIVLIGFLLFAAIFGGLFLVAGGRYLGKRSAAINYPDLPGARPPVMILNNHTMPEHPRVKRRINEVRAEYERKGFDVFVADERLQGLFATTMSEWWNDRKGPADDMLEDLMDRYNVYGIVDVQGKGERNIKPQFVSSTRPGAKERSRSGLSAGRVALFVINDIPSKNTSELSERMDRHIQDLAPGGVTTIVQNARVAEELRELLEEADEDYDDDDHNERERAREKINDILQRQGTDAVVWFDRDRMRPNGFLVRIHAQEKNVVAAMRNLPSFQKPAATPDHGRILLINNHPALLHDNVYNYEQQARSFYGDMGYAFVDDVNAETELRTYLEVMSPAIQPESDRALQALLAQFDLDAVVIIKRSDGLGESHESIESDLIERDRTMVFEEEEELIET